MLRQALWHCEFVYDEVVAAQLMRDERLDLVIPFFVDEWCEFVGVLRTVFVGTDLLFELYDDGRLDAEAVSIASHITHIDARAACRHLAACLA
jgi:hypothetical protein